MAELQLYDFQQKAVDKLAKVVGGLNADDMGLGKTVQGIAIDLEKRKRYAEQFTNRYKGKPLTLVISRKSVLGVWAHHYKKWEPSLKVEVLDPKKRAVFIDSFLKGKADVYICHYESLRLMLELQKIQWFHVIADEVHAIKNRKAQVTQNLKKIATVHRLGLSGTPADNRPDDLWSILHWLYPKTFTSYWKFYDRHVLYREVANEFTGRRYREILGVAKAEELQKHIEPIFVRRLKEDVIPDLPEKYYTTIFCDLTPQQRRAYDDMRDHMLTWVGEHEDEPIAAPVIIAQLTRLQQFACAYGERMIVKKHKGLGCLAYEQTTYTDEETGELKSGWLIGTRDEVGYKLHHGRPGEDHLCPRCGEYLLVETEALKLTDPSSKLDTLMQIIEDNPDQPMVIFAQSKQVIKLLCKRLEAAKISHAEFSGDTPASKRDQIIDDFQDGKIQIFAGTIKAGGVGITLTRASTIIFLDRDWSPSANKQTEDRLHRIGQINAVQVIDIVARHTVDLGRMQQIKLKWTWLKQMLGDRPEPQRELEED